MDSDDIEWTRNEDTNVANMDSDVDSAFEEAQPDLISLTSSIFDCQIENGRSYHSMSEGKYVYPNDDLELARLDLQHHIWLLTFDGALACSPGRHTAKRVLDMGTGTGIWAIDFADTYPESEVIGVDLSASQPDLLPSNCSFEIDDLELDWRWNQPFDFIFCRSMAGSWSDFRSIIQKAYDNLTPGGYFEVQDIELPTHCDDGSVPSTAAIYRWEAALLEASNEIGRSLNCAAECVEDLKSAGFVDICHQVFKWPFNKWPQDPKLKEIGRWHCANMDMGVEGFSLALLTRVKGWPRADVEALCEEVKRESKDTRMHGYWRMHAIHARKPGAS
ncbi:hypothetical protein EsH8_VIII_000337 [Colletotrichum jinshuiense]